MSLKVIKVSGGPKSSIALSKVQENGSRATDRPDCRKDSVHKVPCLGSLGEFLVCLLCVGSQTGCRHPRRVAAVWGPEGASDVVLQEVQEDVLPQKVSYLVLRLQEPQLPPPLHHLLTERRQGREGQLRDLVHRDLQEVGHAQRGLQALHEELRVPEVEEVVLQVEQLLLLLPLQLLLEQQLLPELLQVPEVVGQPRGQEVLLDQHERPPLVLVLPALGQLRDLGEDRDPGDRRV